MNGMDMARTVVLEGKLTIVFEGRHGQPKNMYTLCVYENGQKLTFSNFSTVEDFEEAWKIVSTMLISCGFNGSQMRKRHNCFPEDFPKQIFQRIC